MIPIMTNVPPKILLRISNVNNYSAKIAKAGKLQNTHTRNILKEFKKLEIIEYTYIYGKIKYLKLTKKGKEI